MARCEWVVHETLSIRFVDSVSSGDVDREFVWLFARSRRIRVLSRTESAGALVYRTNDCRGAADVHALAEGEPSLGDLSRFSN